MPALNMAAAADGVGWAVVRRLGGGGYDSVVTFVGI
jgi:hypothetical protein